MEDLPRLIDETFDDNCIVTQAQHVEYFNIPASFDIEVTSFFRTSGKEEFKGATMYVWQFGINGYVIMGRTWEEYKHLIEILHDELGLNDKRRLIVYVHNLAYEFQFIRKHFEWDNVFSIKTRKPIYARDTNGIEYRCSYLLSGYSLAKLGQQLQKYPVTKAVGELDYSLYRHSETPLTDEEIDYCVRDVLVVMAYIQEKIEQYGKITKLPLTKTGYVRNFCRTKCYHEDKGKSKDQKYKALRFREIIKDLTLEPDEYRQLKRGFQGGFTHGSVFYHGKVIEHVGSYDFTSSYPAVMVAEKFPMSTSELIPAISKNEFFQSLRYYCCLFDIKIYGLRPKLWHENYISVSRCRNLRNPVVNNGRLVSADELITTITEQDFFIIWEYYEIDKFEVKNFRRYHKGYLPTEFVAAILQLYSDKTKLKGIVGKEVEYLNSKEMINATYGMSVTDIYRPEYTYYGDWADAPIYPDLGEAIAKYNKQKRRFLYYPWGVWVTAYARRNLFTGISEFKDDYIYSDTDSVKGRNVEKHLEYIDRYNQAITVKLEHALTHHGLNPELLRPKDIKGIEHPLGLWSFEGYYKAFKTLGAKRYMVQYDKPDENGYEYNLTVAGVNKKVAIPYIVDVLCKYPVLDNGTVLYDKPYKEPLTPFDIFKLGMKIHKGYTGGNVYNYIDDEFTTELVDYMGNVATVHELSCIYMEPDEYTLDISAEYLDFIDMITGGYIEE